MLIFRTGSIGDAVVSLPAMHVIARAFPDSHRVVLTNRPVMAKTSAVDAVLGPTGLAHETIHFETGQTSPAALWALLRQLRRHRPKTLIWLSEGRGRISTLVLRTLFALAGARRFIGVPGGDYKHIHRQLIDSDNWESEAHRLARAVGELGDAALDEPVSWDFHFSDAERQGADSLLAGWPGADRFIGFSIGGKASVKDWGDDNWRQTLGRLSDKGIGLVLFGATDEAERSRALAKDWPGPVLDLCGRASPRVSSLVLSKALLYLGHDSGPMHLAAATGTPAVAMFAGQRKPGVWFPHGARHHPLYNQTPCFGCYLDVCTEFQKKCIMGISPDAVVAAVRQVLAESRTEQPEP